MLWVALGVVCSVVGGVGGSCNGVVEFHKWRVVVY